MNAVRASFFAKLHEGVAHESLRYAEIRTAIREKRPISDRTLSKALARLVADGKVRRRSDGAYELVIKFERADTAAVLVAADKMSIDAGATIGIVGSQDQGWTVYGIPRGKPPGLRSRLRRAIDDFQGEVDYILRAAADAVVGKTLKKARSRRLGTRDATRIRRILMQVFDFWETLRFEHLGSFAWAVVMERLAPGVLPQIMEKLVRPPVGIEEDLKAGLSPHKSMAKRPQEWVPYLSRLYSQDTDSVRKAWPRFLAEAEEGAAAIELLRGHLTKREWQRFGQRWSSILATRYWLCAVIR